MLHFLVENTLEPIPKVIASHEKECEKTSQDIDVYKAIFNSVWSKEEKLRGIKTQAAKPDRKIELTLASTDKGEDRKEETK